MKTLYSCGCSFMSQDISNANISFLDQYATIKGFKHVSLARSGATNFLIRLQIEEAIQQNADYIVISATSSDRIDFPVAENIPCPVRLSNVDYQGYHCGSEKNVNSKGLIISDSINNWTTIEARTQHNNNRRIVNNEQIEAIKHYLAHLHNFSLEQSKDYYIISEGLRKLIALDKKFIFMGGPMFYLDWSFVGSSLWTAPQPWDIPDGLDSTTVNHTAQSTHDKFTKTLIDLTPEWTN